MKENFYESLDVVLKHEGGYVDHPEDPGGRTNMGITQAVYEKYLGRTVTEEEMKDMKIGDVRIIYKESYWDKIKGDDLPSGIDFCVFDWAVNSGVSRASRALQKIVGVKDDGVIGPNTLKAVNSLILFSQFIFFKSTPAADKSSILGLASVVVTSVS